jgi:hypothetical protein
MDFTQWLNSLPAEITGLGGQQPSTRDELFDPYVEPQIVGGDVLGQTAEQALADVYEGGGLGGFGRELSGQFAGLIDRGGELDEERMAQRFETQQEYMNRARQAQMSQAEGALAERGMLSGGGIAQGPTGTAIGNIESDLAQQYAPEMRNIMTEESQASDRRLIGSLTAATGLAANEVNSMLKMADSVGQRQEMLSNVVGNELDRNMKWNQFLAEHDLKRNIFRDSAQRGQVDMLLRNYQNWLRTQEQAGAGYIGNE